MRSGTHAFVVALALLSAGTSTIGYVLAHDVATRIPANPQPVLQATNCRDIAVRKFDGSLTADDMPFLATCEREFGGAAWNAYISYDICTAFAAYEKSCAQAQRRHEACPPLAGFLSSVGVPDDALTKTQTDAIFHCPLFYPGL